MKYGWRLLAVVLLAVLTACTSYIYGVPQESWKTMSEQERLEAMRIYKERQVAQQKAWEERARQRALELERRQAREAEQAQLRKERVEAVYRGESGTFGDLIRVTLKDGRMRLHGKHHSYQPLSFKIANGDVKELSIADSRGRQRGTLTVAYEDGVLWIDTAKSAKSGRNAQAARLTYDAAWAQGQTYSVSTRGTLEFQNVQAYIEVVPLPGQGGYARSRPQAPQVVIIKEKERPQQPQVVIVKEKERPQQPQVVIIKEKERPQQPQVVVVDHSATEERSSAPVVVPPGKTRLKRQEVAGDTIVRPDRIMVKLRGGQMKIAGKHQRFRPVQFEIAEGETRQVSVAVSGKKSGTLTVSFENGVLYVDGDARGGEQAGKVRYEPAWAEGKGYRLSTAGALSLIDVDLTVEAVKRKGA